MGTSLVGGFKYFLFSSLLGEGFQFDYYFSNGLETTNQVPFFLVQPCDFFKFHVHFVSTKKRGKFEATKLPRPC